MDADKKPTGMGRLLDEETWEALKAAGYSEEELLAHQPTGPIIYSYSRRQAIEDGILVDLWQHPTAERPELDDLRCLVRQAGFNVPMAMTVAAFKRVIAPIEGDPDPGEPIPPGETLESRLWEMLMALRAASRRLSQPSDRVHFEVRGVRLWALCGPGDEGEPVITIMLEGED